MNKIFVTSSGTNIGKTLVTCALARAYRKSKRSVHAIKPVISGFNPNIVPNDIFYICEALDKNYITSQPEINFAAFKMPLSPDMAARAEKKPGVNYNKLKEFCKNPTLVKTDNLIVETVGGLMVPVNTKKTFLNLVEDCADKVVLVAGSYLGSLNHTLATYKILTDAGKRPDMVIITQNLAKSEALYIPVKQTIKSLENFVSAPMIGIEKMAGTESARINKLAGKLIDAKVLKILGS